MWLQLKKNIVNSDNDSYDFTEYWATYNGRGFGDGRLLCKCRECKLIAITSLTTLILCFRETRSSFFGEGGVGGADGGALTTWVTRGFAPETIHDMCPATRQPKIF